ncbi:hypothetical protein [Kineococcus sp. SYSU DK003]|uniref:hypothetical protein n=1 Tax=Kineococcus sp. SYSU DK003 TaxID=3383124 RepID=UPI003D7D1FB1
MTQPLQDVRPARSLTTLVVAGVLVALIVVSALVFWRLTRPCGAGAGDPQKAVTGVLAALQDNDERGLCQRVSLDYRIPEDQAVVLRERVGAAGGVAEVRVAEVEEQQMGSLHVVVATAPDGGLVGRFQTIPGQRGAMVVRATTSAVTW